MRFKQFVEQDYYKIFVNDLTETCKKKKYMMRTLGAVGKYDIYSVVVNPKAPITIGFSGTVHGDEIAGVCSILEFLKRVTIPSDVRILAIPLMNPVGFDAHLHTGIDKVNINRRFSFAPDSKHEAGIIKQALVREKLQFFHAIHEDNEAHGFYVYYFNDRILPQCRAILDIAERYFPIDDRKDIYGDEPIEPGIIRTNTNTDRGCLETWLHKRGVENICTETPGRAPLKDRIECEVEIMQFVLDTFK